MRTDFRELLTNRLCGIAKLDEAQTEALEAHYGLMAKWNRVLNLTAIDKLADVVERHYCESIFAALHIPPENWSIADIGSGPGFPGFPIAVMRRDCRVTLVESHQRKAVFLREVSRSQSNIYVNANRAEEVRERFNWA